MLRLRVQFPVTRYAIPALVLGSACTSDPGTGPGLVVLEAVAGEGQSGYVGATLPNPLVVRAVDNTGESVPGVTVTWSVLSGGGTVTPLQATTDANGMAAASYRLGGELGEQSARAYAGTAVPVVFDVNATVGPPASLTLVSGGNQSAKVNTTLASDIVIRVKDAYNHLVAGAEVTFVVNTGGGTVTPTTAISDANGIVRCDWTLGPNVGTQTMTAVIFAVQPITIQATGNP
jgi:hypothetical protein